MDNWLIILIVLALAFFLLRPPRENFISLGGSKLYEFCMNTPVGKQYPSVCSVACTPHASKCFEACLVSGISEGGVVSTDFIEDKKRECATRCTGLK